MAAAPIPSNDDLRVETLYSYDVLDTMAEESFDDICALASAICDTPIALITLVDRRRQWFKSVVGLDLRETERECSICSYAILDDDMLVIDDLLGDQRTCDNRLVVRAPNMRFYGGEPLHAFNGFRLGTLCVIDQRARALDSEQKAALRVLARQVEAQLEVRRLNAELVRIDGVREQLTQFVAHDLSSPITAITLGLHELQRPSWPDRVRAVADELAAAADALHSMVADLRDASVGRAGALAPRYQGVELSVLIDSEVRAAKPRLRSRGLEVRVGVGSEKIAVEADPSLLHRLLQNLLSNACHYAEALIEIGCAVHDGEQIEIHVDDDGPGIADERKAAVFDLYAQAWDEEKDASRGIGLAFCRAVAHAHGGTIEVLDREPRGSRFRVVLPRSRPAPAAAAGG
ncbi:MAG TPA: GAF domain-containing sensor histidine kinase [Kofleriaceae bacterium]|nr:GAF domain-containing sensor histidine kinase [Kofleriaceae bacterium]